MNKETHIDIGWYFSTPIAITAYNKQEVTFVEEKDRIIGFAQEDE